MRKKMHNKQPLLTIGIPTYYGGKALVRAVESILASRGVGAFKIIVTVDGNPLQPAIHEALTLLTIKIAPAKSGE
jgi:cephalosporin hydroxylase